MNAKTYFAILHLPDLLFGIALVLGALLIHPI